MICTEQTILILLLRVTVECCLSGHVNMARCIRLLCAAPMCNIFDMKCYIAICPGVGQHPGFFMLKIHTNQTRLSNK